MSITSRRDIHYLLLRPATLVIIIRKCRDWLKVHQNDFSSEVRSKYISKISHPSPLTGHVQAAWLVQTLLDFSQAHSTALVSALLLVSRCLDISTQYLHNIYTIPTQYLHNIYTARSYPDVQPPPAGLLAPGPSLHPPAASPAAALAGHAGG